MNRFCPHSSIAWIVTIAVIVLLSVFLIAGYLFLPGMKRDIDQWWESVKPTKHSKPRYSTDPDQ